MQVLLSLRYIGKCLLLLLAVYLHLVGCLLLFVAVYLHLVGCLLLYLLLLLLCLLLLLYLLLLLLYLLLLLLLLLQDSKPLSAVEAEAYRVMYSAVKGDSDERDLRCIGTSFNGSKEVPVHLKSPLCIYIKEIF